MNNKDIELKLENYVIKLHDEVVELETNGSHYCAIIMEPIVDELMSILGIKRIEELTG